MMISSAVGIAVKTEKTKAVIIRPSLEDCHEVSHVSVKNKVTK